MGSGGLVRGHGVGPSRIRALGTRIGAGEQRPDAGFRQGVQRGAAHLPGT